MVSNSGHEKRGNYSIRLKLLQIISQDMQEKANQRKQEAESKQRQKKPLPILSP